MVGFAFLLPFLTWPQAAGAAVLALLFNVFLLPHLDIDLRRLPRGSERAGLSRRGSAEGSTLAETEAGFWTETAFYPLSILALVLLYRHNLHVAAAIWSILALGDGMARVASRALKGPTLPYNRQKEWSGFCGFLLAGTLGAYVVTRWVAPPLPAEKVLGVCAATAAVAALVESIPMRLSVNVSVPLISAGFMSCAYLVERSALASNLPYLKLRVILAVAVNAVFALLALESRMITRSGAVAGFFLGMAVYLGYGYKSFLIMLIFVLLGSMATRLGYKEKTGRGIAERRGGARSWREALANGLAGAFFAVLVITTPHESAFLMALVATFAEAAGDTVSSEIGQWLSRRAYLVTTFKSVSAGENGAVSLVGTGAGLAASAMVVALGYALGFCGGRNAWIALAAAVAGNLLDSVLGATLERRGWITNGIVNFAGTSFAGVLTLVLRLG